MLRTENLLSYLQRPFVVSLRIGNTPLDDRERVRKEQSNTFKAQDFNSGPRALIQHSYRTSIILVVASTRREPTREEMVSTPTEIRNKTYAVAGRQARQS